MHIQLFAGAARMRAPHGSRAKIVQRNRDAHVILIGRDAMRGIKTHPAQVFDISLRPSVARRLVVAPIRP